MRDIQVSRPVLIALIGAIVVGGFLYFKSQSSDEPVPPPPVAPQPAPTGASGATDEAKAPAPTGATGEATKKETAKQRRERIRKERRAKLIEQAEQAGMPLNVYQALHNDKVVLIYFRNPKGQTDQHVDRAVDEVKKKQGKKLFVVREKISNKSRYQGIAEVAEITQTPGIVMLYGRAADAWQGFIDGAALNARLERLLDQG